MMQAVMLHIISSSPVFDVDLLMEEHGAGGLEGGEGAIHLQIGHHVMEFTIETMKKGEDEGAVVDGIAKLCQGSGHHLEVMAEVGDGLPSLLGSVELSGEKSTQFVLPEELIL